VSVDVSVIIVTFNSRAVVGRCLDSLQRHIGDASREVILVDNASADGTAGMVEQDYPWVRVIHRKRNGLSAAINDGVSVSSGKHVMQLNPDTHFDRDVTTPLSRYLAERPDVGVVAPKLVNDDGTLQLSCRAFPGYATALFNRYSLFTKLVPGNRYSREYLMADFDHSVERDVDWVSGAALMFPRAAYDSVGGWDAGFFLFNEDVDFCRRIHDAGLRVVYEPSVVVSHSIGISRSTSARMVIVRHRSMWRYYRKHLGGSAARDALTAAGIAGRCAFTLVSNAVLGVVRQARAK
jgi:N-acetylglucosaminyl-diphospho-decaprenol L-rhamnosyltransferase